MAVLIVSSAQATPTVQTLTDGGGQYYSISNGALTNFKLYLTGGNVGKVTSLTFDGQQMIGSKGLYDDINDQNGALGLTFYNSATQFSVRSGSNFADVSLFHPATATEPLDVTWHWILQDGQSAFSSYLRITIRPRWLITSRTKTDSAGGVSTTAIYFITPRSPITTGAINRLATQIAIKAASSLPKPPICGIPSEYTKNFETKYDWRDTYAPIRRRDRNCHCSEYQHRDRPLGRERLWRLDVIENYRAYESWNSGPTHPQTPVPTAL